MTNKAFISKIVLLILLATMVFQTKHSYDHLMEQLEAPICHHEDTLSKKQITHAHHSVETCKVCAFSVSSLLSPNPFFWKSIRVETFSKTSITSSASSITFYVGSLFALRAPPLA